MPSGKVGTIVEGAVLGIHCDGDSPEVRAWYEPHELTLLTNETPDCSPEEALTELLKYAPGPDDLRLMLVGTGGKELTQELRDYANNYEEAWREAIAVPKATRAQ